MKKNLTSLLQKGNLTPKERCQMFVQNVVAIERDGKGFLSDADKYALVEGWHPKDNYEIREFNKYNSAWRSAVLAEMDAQMTFLRAENAHLMAEVAVTYYLLADGELCKKRGNKTLFELIQRCGLIEQYALLLGYKDIFTRLSKIYNVDLTDKVDAYLAFVQKDIKSLNNSLGFIKDKFGSEAYMLYDFHYFMDVPQASCAIDPDKIEPAKEGLKIYYDEFEKVLGEEFGTVHNEL